MANEINFNATLEVSNGSLKVSQKRQRRADQTTAGAWVGVQNIGTTEEVLSVAGVVAARAILIENLDDTNYVDFGPEVAGALEELIQLQPGDIAMLPLFPGAVIRGKANTAAVDVAYMLVET